MINNLGTPSSELQINFGVLQIDTENSATGKITLVFSKTVRIQNFRTPSHNKREINAIAKQ